MDSLIGETLGKYRILAYLGRGGMADVYQAHQPGLERSVAVKVLHRHLSDDKDFVGRFEREAAAVARLRHPNIVQVYDSGSEGDSHYMVMELIEGRTLEVELQECNQQGQLFSLAETTRVVDLLSGAIDYAHSQEMFHRDLKPANIMFAAGGRVVLTDFGVARIVDGTRYTATGALIGTPAYMSPEQCQGERGDARCDIYSLGVILYKMVTGRTPFESDTPFGLLLSHVNDPVPPPTTVNPDLPSAVELVILKALSKSPDDRYQTAGEMAAALRHATDMTTGQLSAPEPARIERAFVLPEPSREPSETPYLDKRPEAPFQVPRDVAHFVGRQAEISEFFDLLTRSALRNIYCLTGMGGIGKTALAVHLAYLLRDNMVDGVLWANMATSEPLAILDSWARAYGYDFSALPDLDSRAAALRSELTGKAVLMILDDVQSADQVRPLLPGGFPSFVLLTTRDVDLPVVLDAHEFHLSELMPAESYQMLSRIVGDERVAAEDEAAGEIGQLLGNLPLAVEIAAQRLVSRRRWRLADLVERLRDEKERLDELAISDREVRASFAVSWDMLDANLRQLFAFLAVFQGRAFRTPALAAVAEMDRNAAEDTLYALIGLSLVSEEGERHYRQHPLLADFAREHLGLADAAYTRMAHYYLGFAREHQQDYTELRNEWENFSAGMRVAHQRKLWPTVIEYTQVLTEAWSARGRFTEARQGYGWAREAARALGDNQALADALYRWGRACIEQADYAQAEKRLSRSFWIYSQLNDRRGAANAQYHLGYVCVERARYEKAKRLLIESQRTRKQLGDTAGVAETLYQQANIQYYGSNYEEAEQLSQQALEMQQTVNDRLGSIRSLRLLADIAFGMDDYDLAAEHCQGALELSQELENKGELAATLYALSEICRRRGDLANARTNAAQGLALFKNMGNKRSQAHALYQLSMVDQDLGDSDLALEEGFESLNLCQELGDAQGMVYVLRYLGDFLKDLGQLDQAREMWSEALRIAEELQDPLSESLQERLFLDQ